MKRMPSLIAFPLAQRPSMCFLVCLAVATILPNIVAAQEQALDYIDKINGLTLTAPKGWTRIEHPGLKAAFVAQAEGGWADNIVVQYMPEKIVAQAFQKSNEETKKAYPSFVIKQSKEKEVVIAGRKGIKSSAEYLFAPQIKNGLQSLYFEVNDFVIAVHLTYRNMDEQTAEKTLEAVMSSTRVSEPSLRIPDIIRPEGYSIDDLIEKGAIDDANIALTPLLAQHPDDPLLLICHGSCLAKKGRGKDAVAILRRAFDRGWFDSTFLYDDEKLKPVAADLFGTKSEHIGNLDQGRSYLLERLRRLLPEYQTIAATEKGAIILTDIREETVKGQLRQAALTTASFAKNDLEITPPFGGIIWVIPRDREMTQGLMEKMTGGKATGMGMYFPSIGMLLADMTTGFGTLTHEYMHALHHCDQMVARQIHKLWIVEMIGSIYEGLDKNEEVVAVNWRTPIVKAAQKNGTMIPLKKLLFMNDAQLTDPAHYNLAMAQLRHLGVYLRSKGVLGKFYRLYKAHHNEDSSGEMALTGATGLSLVELEKHWQAWINELQN